jgi:hypothetical protein
MRKIYLVNFPPSDIKLFNQFTFAIFIAKNPGRMNDSAADAGGKHGNQLGLDWE